MGAEKVIAMSRHEPRQEIATEFGATHIVAERGKEGAAAVKEITGGVGADAVLECVGTDDVDATRRSRSPARVRPSASSASRTASSCRCGGCSGKNVGLAGGMAPVRRYLPELLELVLRGRIDPGLVFDLTLPLDEVAEGYRAMDERARDQGAARALIRRRAGAGGVTRHRRRAGSRSCRRTRGRCGCRARSAGTACRATGVTVVVWTVSHMVIPPLACCFVVRCG